jgi:hypothetical protein
VDDSLILASGVVLLVIHHHGTAVLTLESAPLRADERD